MSNRLKYLAGHVPASQGFFLSRAQKLEDESGSQIHQLFVIFQSVESVEEITSWVVIFLTLIVFTTNDIPC